MKKHLILLLLIVLASCSTSKIKYVRVDKSEREVVNVDEIDRESFTENKLEFTQNNAVENDIIEPLNLYTSTDEITVDNTDKNVTVNPAPADSVAIEDKVYIALEAEDLAIKTNRRAAVAQTLSISSFVFLITFIPALIMTIIAWVSYSRLKQYPFNTREGMEYERKAKGKIISAMVILLLILALLTALILLAIL